MCPFPLLDIIRLLMDQWGNHAFSYLDNKFSLKNKEN